MSALQYGVNVINMKESGTAKGTNFSAESEIAGPDKKYADSSSSYEVLTRTTKNIGKDALKFGVSTLAFVLPGDWQKNIAKKIYGDEQDERYLAFKSGSTEVLLGYGALIGSTIVASPILYGIGAYAVFEGLGRTVISHFEKKVCGTLAVEVPYQVLKTLKRYSDSAKRELIDEKEHKYNSVAVG